MRWLMLILMFIFLGAFFIVSNNNLHLANQSEFSQFGSMYYFWLGHIFDNVKSVTGYVVEFGWLPDNQTFVNSSKVKK